MMGHSIHLYLVQLHLCWYTHSDFWRGWSVETVSLGSCGGCVILYNTIHRPALKNTIHRPVWKIYFLGLTRQG